MHPSALLAGEQFFHTYCPATDVTVLNMRLERCQRLIESRRARRL